MFTPVLELEEEFNYDRVEQLAGKLMYLQTLNNHKESPFYAMAPEELLQDMNDNMAKIRSRLLHNRTVYINNYKKDDPEYIKAFYERSGISNEVRTLVAWDKLFLPVETALTVGTEKNFLDMYNTLYGHNSTDLRHMFKVYGNAWPEEGSAYRKKIIIQAAALYAVLDYLPTHATTDNHWLFDRAIVDMLSLFTDIESVQVKKEVFYLKPGYMLEMFEKNYGEDQSRETAVSVAEKLNAVNRGGTWLDKFLNGRLFNF